MTRRFITYLILISAFVSCKKENRTDCFKSNGDTVTEARYPGRFDSIAVYDKFDVTLSKGTEYKVEVTAGKHIIGNISTTVKNGNLRIENNNRCNFVRGYKHKLKIHITTPYIRKVFHDGVGPITFVDGFKQDTLFLRLENSGDIHLNGTFSVLSTSSHGNGDLYLSGTSDRLNMYTNGTNYIYGEDFRIKNYLYLSTYSIGDVQLNLQGLQIFEYLIWSSGNIYYKNAAQVMHDLGDGSGKGKAIKEE